MNLYSPVILTTKSHGAAQYGRGKMQIVVVAMGYCLSRLAARLFLI